MILVIDRPQERIRPDIGEARRSPATRLPPAWAGHPPPWPGPPVPRPSLRRDPANPDWKPI